jgi:hypothetical protein
LTERKSLAVCYQPTEILSAKASWSVPLSELQASAREEPPLELELSPLLSHPHVELLLCNCLAATGAVADRPGRVLRIGGGNVQK